MAENKNIRLNKVLKEFNVGIGTVTEFLAKKGIEIEAKPNTLLDSNAYNLIAKEFGKDLLIKQESEKISLNVKKITAQDNEDKSEESIDQEVIIKSNINSAPIAPVTNETEKNTTDSKAVSETVPVSTPEKDIKVNAEATKEPVAEPIKENKEAVASESSKEESSTPAAGEIKILGKIDLDSKPAKVEPKAESKTEVIEENNKVSEQTKNPLDFKQQIPAKVARAELKKENKAEARLEQKKAEKALKAQTPAKVEKVEAAPVQKEEKKADVIEHIETKVNKLAGPVISGTIDLSQFEKKPSSNNNKNQKKGKRERISNQGRERVDINKEAAKKNNPGGRNPQQRTNNPNNNNNNNSNNPNNNNASNNPNAQRARQNQANPNSRRNKKDRFTKPVQPEVDEDQIQKQIKETYARMTEGKGKTKGSKYRKEKRDQISQKRQEEMEMEELTSNILKVTEFVTVNELAIMMDTAVVKVIEACMNLGLMVSINQRLDAEALVLVAEEFGYKIEFVTADITEAIEEDVDLEEDLIERPPIVTVMGHVDHGKTSLLDYIRSANVIAGEAGGITQHIGAYNVELESGRRITFLDTPGHEAFTAMRARGAKVTDLAIIIVAADDAIMPQTVEAINHAQAAGVPMVFAINKMDKPGANAEKIREQLSLMNILVEDWGGKYQCQEISAKNGTNIDLLLEKVLLETDMLELKANPNKRAKGSIIESSLDKGRGYLATILVETGTLKVGDFMLTGSHTGKVKAMYNERGQKVNEAGPSSPVSVLGLNGAPTAGETFNIMANEKEAKDLANKREQLIRIQGLRTQKHITLEEIGRRIAVGNFQELNIIIKGDVDGSIEALSDSLIKLSTEEIHVNVIHKAVGAISESDVLLAVASNAIIIGFQVRPVTSARKLADNEEIEIRLYSIIYDAINEVRSGIEGMLAPEEKEEVVGTAEVRETFKISKVGTIAGCMVKDGKINRNSQIRVIRDGIVVYTGLLGSLKRFKDDVKEVSNGFDCGLNVEGFNDIKVGDVIEAYAIVQIKRTL